MHGRANCLFFSRIKVFLWKVKMCRVSITGRPLTVKLLNVQIKGTAPEIEEDKNKKKKGIRVQVKERDLVPETKGKVKKQKATSKMADKNPQHRKKNAGVRAMAIWPQNQVNEWFVERHQAFTQYWYPFQRLEQVSSRPVFQDCSCAAVMPNCVSTFSQ